MKVTVRESTIVKPAKETPKLELWNSNLDLLMPPIHTPLVFFYRPNGTTTNFFNISVIKDALSRVLVAFYPMAGGLKAYDDGRRTKIDCQGQGVLFVEAESDSMIDDLGDFAPTSKFNKLILTIGYSLSLESHPLLTLQVTYFKCGGVSLGAGVHHYLGDATSLTHFFKTWSEMARGFNLVGPNHRIFDVNLVQTIVI